MCVRDHVLCHRGVEVLGGYLCACLLYRVEMRAKEDDNVEDVDGYHKSARRSKNGRVGSCKVHVVDEL